jgi:transposase, IS5 family
MLKCDEIEGCFFEVELSELVSEKDQLVRLSRKIDWKSLTNKISKNYDLSNGRPGVPIRALCGVLILKYLYGVSDVEAMCNLLRMPTWQYFCGYRYHFKDKAPFERSLISIFRKRIGEEGARAIFESSCAVAQETNLLKASEYKKIHVDTTVQEKNITYPHSVKLLRGMLRKLEKNSKKKILRSNRAILGLANNIVLKP